MFDRHNIEIAASISRPRALGIIERARKELWIPIPTDFKELGEKLEKNKVLKKIYKGFITAGDGGDGDAVLFMHDDMINELNNARILYIDGVFKV